VIETPPEGRRPVKTYVGEYDEQLVKQALEREKARGGQAFFLHNRVEDIDETAVRLRALCPGLSFTVAHGQMDEKLLEDRMISFLRGDADVLVSTSIIESGIDIPQANTLIVERSDIFGLSQLYQIRGRVGRSRERAYAYLLYPSAGALDVNVDAYVPADYIPYEQAKVEVHRRIAGAREVAELQELRRELDDRFGELPEPLENLIALQQARIKLGEAGARAVSFRQGRLAVTPVELDSVRARRLREVIPNALYESGKSQFSMRVPDDPAQRFPAVVRAADALLAVQRDAA
jgi:transcription-repair coupling factor (superfamily II helicase)